MEPQDTMAKKADQDQADLKCILELLCAELPNKSRRMLGKDTMGHLPYASQDPTVAYSSATGAAAPN